MANMWDQRYAEQGYAYGTEPNDFLTQVTPRLPRGRALCLAEGEGRNAVWLAKHGLFVTGVDGSAVGLEKAQALAAERQVSIHTVVADLSAFPIEPASWDVIVSIWCHLPSTLRQKVHRACVAGLKPGGAFVLEAYTPKQLAFGTGGPKDVDMLPTLTGLKAELAGLDFEVGEELERPVHEGKLHAGHSAVVQVLAFKPKA